MPRKGENIYKRKDDRWEARYIHHYEGGKAKYKSIYGNSYTEVRAKRLEELSKPENMKATAVKQLSTLQEICVLWLKTKKPDVKESTYTRYVRAVDKYILPAFEIRQLIKIDKTVIYAAFDMLKTRLSDKTVSDIRCIFKSIWKYGIENQYPCCEFHFPRRKEKPSHKILVTTALPQSSRMQTLRQPFLIFLTKTVPLYSTECSASISAQALGTKHRTLSLN